MRVLVTGANGQLGQEIHALAPFYPNFTFIFASKETLDVANQLSIEAFFANNAIDVIINCAAYTAVDKAESQENLAHNINHLAVKYLGQCAKKYQIKLVHLSTDYVFNGQNYKPYTEDVIPSPQNIYGASKRAGEQALQAINPRDTLIIRTSWLYSTFGNNFVKTMLKLGKEREILNVIYDQIGTPTYAYDLAKAILNIIPRIQNEHVEIYHYANEGVLSWYDFAKEIMKMAKLTCKIMPIETKDYPTPAKRPHYGLLNKCKIKHDFAVEIPYWKDSLANCLEKLGEKK